MPVDDSNPPLLESATAAQLRDGFTLLQEQAQDIYDACPIDCTKQIRLIKVWQNFPGGDDDIVIDIKSCDPREEVYEAISYTWGSTDLTESIVCRGIWVDVTANCHDALLALRSNEIRTWIWIDALCINQADVNERNAQVRRMSDIFYSAHSVIGYPGRKFLHGQMSATFRSPWYSRTWVVQEIMLAKKLKVFIAPEILRTIRQHDYLGENEPRVLGMRFALSIEYGLASQAKGYMSLNYWRLLEMIESTSDFRCRDPRDKLFAILTLFARPIPKLLVPDYSKTVSEVCTDLSWFFIDYDMPVALSLAGTAQSNGKHPSWTTNWTALRGGIPLRKGSFPDSTEQWRAGFQSDNRRIIAQRNGIVLTVRGILLSRLIRLGGLPTIREVFSRDVTIALETSGSLASIFSMFSLEIVHDDNEFMFLTGSLLRYFKKVVPICHSRRTFVTEDGMDGLGPDDVKVDDCLCIFLGFPTPFVVRKSEDSWLLVGECLVSGIMYGEVVDRVDWSGAETDPPRHPFADFNIV